MLFAMIYVIYSQTCAFCRHFLAICYDLCDLQENLCFLRVFTVFWKNFANLLFTGKILRSVVPGEEEEEGKTPLLEAVPLCGRLKKQKYMVQIV